MTRFARAKGSKSSNERLPNDATPWHVMKQQLEETLTTKEIAEEKSKSAKQVVSEKQEPYYYDNLGNVNHEWAKFEDEQIEKKSKKVKGGKFEKSKHNVITKKKVKNILETQVENNLNNHEIPKDNIIALKKCVLNESNVATDQSSISTDVTKFKVSKNIKINNSNSTDPMKKINKKKRKKTTDLVNTNDNIAAEKNNSEPATSKIKVPQKIKAENPDTTDTDVSVNAKKKKKVDDIMQDESNDKKPGVLSKRQKRNQKKRNKNANDTESNNIKDGTENSSEHISSQGFNVKSNDWNSDVKFNRQEGLERECNANENKNCKNQSKINKHDKQNNKLKGNEAHCISQKNHNDPNQIQKTKLPKIRDDEKHERRKPDPGTVKMMISGKEIEIVKYDGFPVKREDAVRLKELKQSMIIKGIPRSEINVAMKLERRKAEKTLAREKKSVCFNCRKSGHNLSDCPELGREENGTGICFKCGSTEHTHFECKVTKGQEFRFAACFICREQGHIARQCPDNPKGLYPDGGACNLCGDVTHLKKDCPDLMREKEETTVTVNKITNNTLECLDEEVTKKGTENQRHKTKNNIIKF